jgi:hypothetical protein
MLKLAALIPDTHRPFHDRRAYNLMIKVLIDLKPDEITMLGDYADIYNLTSHGKDAGLVTSLVEEIEDVNAGLDEIDRLFPKSKKVYIQGNHEYRFERYVNSKCPELFGVTQFDYLLNLNKRSNWKYIHYGPRQRHNVLDSYLVARHEPLGSSAKATATKALCSLVYGHIHRIEESHIVGLDGTNHVSFSVGWLGDKTLDKVFGYVKGHHQWQLGFGLVWVDTKTRYFYHHKIHILDNYTCVVNGKEYRG